MLKHSDESHEGERPEIAALLERLSADGRDWAEAELALARIELDELKRQAVRAIAFALLGCAALFCLFVVLSQAGIAFLTPYVDGAGVAALIVGLVLLFFVLASFLVMRRSLQWRAESILFRWFGHRPSGGARP